MNSKNLLNILISLPYTNYEEYGLIISYADIFNKLKYEYNFDNSDLLIYMLNDLEHSNLIKNIKQTDFDENLIIGVKIK
ncbi:hypothetical protein FDB30_03640 [Clostridium botulinum]|uniref:Uncharacterized protein n=1 Tax=Clostridium botulinum TaxID=1491 RepID=A0A0L9YA78_CLOBO|nr:hypothetical protein [Clostridium botulinum]KAI3350756.1 hypothetical protein CIT18_01585 [Clostridium botulinum]KOM88762.1 hypothetical protein ACP51_05870 [Clostridium botulinum]KOR57598.1 hypothetical protein ADT22_12560 [Clostridium botulinum]MBY7025181.1 hypothetical protein [Clostridium botulinum]NFE58158.1 hypothetical protein [Clostridium botulinum]